MRVNTLVYIKEMLEHEVETRQKAYNKAKKILEEKEDAADVNWNTPDNKVDDNIRLYRGIRKTQYSKLSEAKDALEDFLNQEWD